MSIWRHVTGERPKRLAEREAERQERTAAAYYLSSDAGFNLSIVGESNYQGTLREVDAGRCEVGEAVVFRVLIEREPGNPYDAEAIVVRDEQSGDVVGYLSRKDARAYATVFNVLGTKRQCGLCRARLVGGTEEKPSYGVVLDLKHPKPLLKELTRATTDPDQPF